MFYHNIVVLNILLYSLILPLNPANALSYSGDESFQQVRRQHEEARGNPPESPPSIQDTTADFNDGIHLAVGPRCGILSASAWAGELNTGIDWEKIDTVVAFGDSFTQVGNNGDGSPPSPIRFIGKNPSAGGRSTNGETWVEQLLHFDEDPKHPRRLISYAQTGATTDREIWESRRWADDFPSQLSRFYANYTTLNLNPNTTLYAGYFGINDFWSMDRDGQNQMIKAGKRAARLLRDLHEYSGATNVLWLGMYSDTAPGMGYKRAVWTGLKELHESTHGARKVNFVYADMARLWNAILESYTDFGYTSTKHCLEGSKSSIEDECEDPDRTMFYIGAHPSRQTHFIMAEYIHQVMRQCLKTDNYASLASSHSFYQPMISSIVSKPQIPLLAFLVLAFLAYKPILRIFTGSRTRIR